VDILSISEFEKEFKDILKKHKRDAKKLSEGFAHLLVVLSKQGERALIDPHFKKLKGSENLYRMAISRKRLNIRVIFAFHEDEIVLLSAFEEKKKSDYELFVEKAKKRYKRYFEGGNMR